MMKLKPLKNNIFFKFADRIFTAHDGARVFESTTNAGIVIMGNHEDTAKANRWVEVLAVGPDVSEEIKEGSIVCVAALRWTEKTEFDGVEFWRTNEEEVLAVRTD